MFRLIFSAMLFVFPILSSVVFFKQVRTFFKVRNNNRIFKNLCYEFAADTFPIHRPKDIQRILQKNNTPGHQRNEFIKNYRKLYHSVLSYCIGAFIFSVLWLLNVALTILVFEKAYIEYHIFLIPGAGIAILGLELSPIFKSIGGTRLNKMAHLIDHLMCDLINPDGKMGSTILHLGKTTSILLINYSAFWGYTRLGATVFNLFSIQDNLVHNLVLLLVYQYPLVYIVSHIVNRIYHKYMCKTNKQPSFNFEYLQMTLKNNTYLLFLLFYLFGKSLQIDSNSSVGTVTIEAIGILYLIDTYFDKRNQCERMKIQWQKSGS